MFLICRWTTGIMPKGSGSILVHPRCQGFGGIELRPFDQFPFVPFLSLLRCSPLQNQTEKGLPKPNRTFFECSQSPRHLVFGHLGQRHWHLTAAEDHGQPPCVQVAEERSCPADLQSMLGERWQAQRRYGALKTCQGSI